MDDAVQLRSKRRWYFRFSIGMLLVLIAMVSGYLSGYRLGWAQATKDEQVSSIQMSVYSVSDLIKPKDAAPEWVATDEDFIQLIEMIESVTSLEVNKATGNREETIAPFAKNESLIVAGTRKTQDQLVNLLKRLRDEDSDVDK